MFNLWKRVYVHTFNQYNIQGANVIMADPQYATVIFPSDTFNIVCQEQSLQTVLDRHYDGKVENLLGTLLNDGDKKWSIVVNTADYYYLLACYLKELQHRFKLSDGDVHKLAFSYAYDNFYYGSDPSFVDGFVNKTFQHILNSVFKTYKPTGILDILPVDALPTEMGYFLLTRDLATEKQLLSKFRNVARLVVARLQEAHYNDFSEWCVLNTRQFLNLLRTNDSPEVLSTDFTFDEMMSYIRSDRYLNSMVFDPVYLSNPGTDWNSEKVIVTASRIIDTWEKLFLFQHVSELRRAQAGDDRAARRARRYEDNVNDSTSLAENLQWLKEISEANADGSMKQHTDLAIRYERVKGICDAIKYLLKLKDAPEHLDKPLIKLLGYDILSEAMNDKYNKTLLLVALNPVSRSFQNFIDDAFKGTE